MIATDELFFRHPGLILGKLLAYRWHVLLNELEEIEECNLLCLRPNTEIFARREETANRIGFAKILCIGSVARECADCV
jgi:hypothetical protein